MDKLLSRGPNLSVIFFLAIPVISIVALTLGLSGTVNLTMVPFRIVEFILLGLLGTQAGLFLAARVKTAPLIATVCGIIILLTAYLCGVKYVKRALQVKIKHLVRLRLMKLQQLLDSWVWHYYLRLLFPN